MGYRYISLVILCPKTRDIDGELAPKVMEHFKYEVGGFKMDAISEVSDTVIVLFDKIPIAEDTDMNKKIVEIQNHIGIRKMHVFELYTDPTFWNKYGVTIASIIGAGAFSIIIWAFSKMYP